MVERHTRNKGMDFPSNMEDPMVLIANGSTSRVQEGDINLLYISWSNTIVPPRVRDVNAMYRCEHFSLLLAEKRGMYLWQLRWQIPRKRLDLIPHLREEKESPSASPF